MALMVLLLAFAIVAPGVSVNIDDCKQACTSNLLPLSTSAPNVLLLSDSIGAQGSGYFENVRTILGPWKEEGPSKSNATEMNALVQHTGGYGKGICGTSFGVVACLDDWVGRSQNLTWDVIHFNWGLHDICPKMYASVTPQQYADNMEEIYQGLKRALKPNGTLIWVTTTPVPPSYKNRNNTDVIRINNQMQKLFGPTGAHYEVIVHDLYAEVVSRCRRYRGSEGYPQTDDCPFLQSNGVHFGDAGKQFTGIMSSAAISPYLFQ